MNLDMKQIITIKVPDGKKAVWKDGRAYFEDVDTMERIRTVGDAIQFLSNKGICNDILDSLSRLPKNSFEWKVAAYRAVVAAVTHNEQRHLTTEERWFPSIEFCRPGKLKNCCGDTILGRIKSEGEEFDVVGDNAHKGAGAGLGFFLSTGGVADAWGESRLPVGWFKGGSPVYFQAVWKASV